jgi:beta-fructofuranosidase
MRTDRFADDSHRPRYHFLPPANWINDPNGPIELHGEYHLFYQHNPNAASWGNMHWGHAFSRDLVRWEHLPPALAPTPGGPDKDGVFSGCAHNVNGTPMLFYTGVHPETQCVALADERLRNFRTFERNPVIPAAPPKLQGRAWTGFRDPFAWKAADGWYALIGSGIEGTGGTALLYRSKDFLSWEYLHPLCVGNPHETGTMWECPMFFDMGERKHLLAVSPYARPVFFLGVYTDHRFSPERQGLLDFGHCYYAPTGFIDSKGRRIVWGWLKERRNADSQNAAGWSGCLSLPRELSLHTDGRLRVRPVEEVKGLRGRHRHFDARNISPGTLHRLDGIQGAQLEIEAEFEVHHSAALGLAVRLSNDGTESTEVLYRSDNRELYVNCDRSSVDPNSAGGLDAGPFALSRGERLRLRVFVDHSVIEVYANERACISSRIYPTQKDSMSVALLARGGAAKLIGLDTWELAKA